MGRPDPVDILLLGSGWTCTFLVPKLKSEQISFARTRRGNSTSNQDDLGSFIPFTLDESITTEQFVKLPIAKLIVIIFPLKTNFIESLVKSYESLTSSTPAWIALGSTGAWQKIGYASSETPPTSVKNERVEAENILLNLSSINNNEDKHRLTTILNLAGLYGNERNPANFAKRVCDSREKLESKTSLHLIHGEDVAGAIIGIYRALQQGRCEKVWGKRWMVTDGHVYDWWELLFTLKPNPIPKGQEWVQELMKEFDIKSLPRPCPVKDEKPDVPRQLERALDSSSFWKIVALKPSIGRCDDYSPGGGGITSLETITNKGAL